jgi:hypothetical protein
MSVLKGRLWLATSTAVALSLIPVAAFEAQ